MPPSDAAFVLDMRLDRLVRLKRANNRMAALAVEADKIEEELCHCIAELAGWNSMGDDEKESFLDRLEEAASEEGDGA